MLTILPRIESSYPDQSILVETSQDGESNQEYDDDEIEYEEVEMDEKPGTLDVGRYNQALQYLAIGP